ncbi:MAG: UDP-N-acetylmuramoyl-L-alanine--D-glutamate ligase [Chitinophagaceae bacterium]|nr:UDP-N-acetylmuramoyl-L-alanine--D-glutamate ligase [Chitinophagaceae bacterium]MCW5914308.1 UDP-N-acetylmuramoyl-L-alanine--D-glutamate ligase [Chitinophagaceae bacterium]MCZ2395563.1 UDP-N-acetylmuramoyl-L-alanine--D-glutamate ligase [Chitinophagales bacterium]
MEKQVLILGAGESGIGAALLAAKNGYPVFVSDAGKIADLHKKELFGLQIPFEEGGHTLSKLEEADLVIKSPGIPESAVPVKAVREKGTELISEIEWAYRFKGDSKIAAITGSNGKTTTTSLLYHIMKVAGMDVALTGNIGYSLARQIATDPKPYYVVEVSSFQLDDIKTFRPDVAVLTNITEDHLDRYGYKFENYIRSKFGIIRNQKEEDIFIYNEDDTVTMQYLPEFLNQVKALPISMRNKLKEGAYISDYEMNVRFRDEVVRMSVEDFALKGNHNKYNSMAASLAATALGVKKDSVREALSTMESLAHRMQPIVTIGGVEFINDSKATNVNSTWYALESMQKPVVLILGGVDKGNDYRILEDLVKEKVRAIVCLGIDNRKIHEAFSGMTGKIVDAMSAEDAAEKAYALAQKGDVVLLSPACASFDLFKNYEDRGNQFMSAVREL